MTDDTNHQPAVLTVFRSRLRPGAEKRYRTMADEMEARARAIPGFVYFKTFVAEDSERVSIIVFDSWSNHRAWRDDTEHRHAQAMGRAEFYDEYDITVCEVAQRRMFPS